jgi:SAM-dependent methyltransferase
MGKEMALIARRVLPAPLRRAILRATRWPPVGMVFFGSLGRTRPISSAWGGDRGLSIDRYYIECFLGQHAEHIRGHVLEIKSDLYTTRFGGSRVTKLDILNAPPGNPQATIVADLTRAEHLPGETFDCIVLTQTLQFIYDMPAAVRTLHRLLKPGGVLIGTVPGISKIDRADNGRTIHQWSLTSGATRRLFADVFGAEHVQVQTYGNVLAAVAFLHGLAREDVGRRKLEVHDPDYEMLIGVRAVKPARPAQ